MANFNFNKVILGGRLVATPELKKTPSGVSVVQFTVAVTRKYGGKDESGQAVQAQADFIRVTAWRQMAEFVTRYFSKGSSVCVVGTIQTRSWTDQQGNKQYTTEVVAEEINFVDSKGEGGSVPPPPSDADAPRERSTGAAPAPSAPPPAYYTPEGGNVPQFEELASDEELPF